MQIKRQSTELGKGKSKRYLFYLAYFFIGHVQTTNIDKKKKSQIQSSTNGRASGSILSGAQLIIRAAQTPELPDTIPTIRK